MDHFHIDDTSTLHLESKQPCESCSKRQKLYCVHCVKPIHPHKPPRVELPFSIDILMDICENNKKSTALHLPIISPNQTRLLIGHYRRDGLPKQLFEGIDCKRLLVLFPSNESQDITSVDPTSFDRVVVIDGTWRQAKAIATIFTADYPLIRKVHLSTHDTLFWRTQSISMKCVSTIEAIYYLVVAVEQLKIENGTHSNDKDRNEKDAQLGYRDKDVIDCQYQVNDDNVEKDNRQKSNGNIDKVYRHVNYDNLLYYFKYQYDLIQQSYKNTPGKSFTSKKLDSQSYIQCKESTDV